jgi:membrane-associated protease RseP (regulator of RpoE activity)
LASAPPVIPPPLDVAGLRARLERRFRVYDVQSDENVVAFFIDAPRETLDHEFEELKTELKEEGLVPILKYQGGEHAIYILRTPPKRKTGWKLNLVLFLATLLTTTIAGASAAFAYEVRDVSSMTQLEASTMMLSPHFLLLGFVEFAFPLLLILGVHEMGHYVMTRRHGMHATLPFFIPVPPIFTPAIGTFGAFIAMREPMPNKKALFDIGASGPIAGFIVAVPVVIIGILLMQANPVVVPPSPDTLTIGTPLLYDLLAAPFHLPDNLMIHPTAFAGWVGLFVTAINLLPAGQLDGGHIASAMFGDRAKYASYTTVAGLVGLGIAPWLGFQGSENWIVFAILIGFLGIRHPPTLNAVSTLGTGRMIVGWLTFGIGVLCFTLVPFQ